jgi:biotin carboxyl carrier protein
MTVHYFVKVGGETVEVDVELQQDGSCFVRGPDREALSVNLLAQHGPLHTLSLGGQIVEVLRDEGEVRFERERFSVHVESALQRAAAHSGTRDARESKEIVAPMPGRIVRISCTPGEAVRKGTALVVIEAMKMQNELLATIDGVVRAIRVKGGETVDRGAVLVELE